MVKKELRKKRKRWSNMVNNMFGGYNLPSTTKTMKK